MALATKPRRLGLQGFPYDVTPADLLTAYGQLDGRFDGFHLGSGDVQLDDTLLLIEPEAAVLYEAGQSKPAGPSPEGTVLRGNHRLPRVEAGRGPLFQIKRLAL